MNGLMRLKILIVDDDIYYTSVLQDYFEEKGHTVFSATTTADALEIINRQKEARLPVDLAVIDYVLPGDNGINISHLIAKADPAVFKIALTEYSAPETMEKLIKEGDFILILSKFDPTETLDRTLDVFLSSKKQRREQKNPY